MHIVTLSILVKEMLQHSLGFVLLISSGVESREQSSSPYTLTHWIDLGTWLAFCGSLWASFYSFFLRNRKDTGRVKLLLLLFSNKIISCWYNLYDNYKECANITQGLTIIIAPLWGFSSGSAVKVHLQCRKPGFNPWVRKIPWRRAWQLTPAILPGKSHRLRSLVGYSPPGVAKSWTWLSDWACTYGPLWFQRLLSPACNRKDQLGQEWGGPPLGTERLHWFNIQLFSVGAGTRLSWARHTYYICNKTIIMSQEQQPSLIWVAMGLTGAILPKKARLGSHWIAPRQGLSK